MARLSQLLCLLSIVSLVSSQAQCYYPDGTPSQDVPCNVSSTSSADSASPCCPANAMCLQNGLCLQDGLLSRGSCTANSWSDHCAQYCIDNNRGGGFPISPCSGSTFACNYAGSSTQLCSSNFTMEGGTNFVLRPSQVPSGGNRLITPYSILDDGGQNTTAANSSSAATATVSMRSGASCSPQSNGYSAGAVAGAAVGVGAPLALALAGAVVYILKQRKELKRQELGRPPIREVQQGQVFSN